MTQYRFYVVGCDGRYVRTQYLECTDDREAVQRSQQVVSKHCIEIWRCGHLVARLPRSDPAPPNPDLISRVEKLAER